MPHKSAGHNLSTHYLLEIREPPASLVALRTELTKHPDILSKAAGGKSFEESIAIIATELDIIMDGYYDVEPMAEMLTTALRNRGTFYANPSLRHHSLVDAELIEKEGTVEIVERDRSVKTIIPDGSVVTTTTSKPTTKSIISISDDAGIDSGQQKAPGEGESPGA